jgi:hypothetical protein
LLKECEKALGFSYHSSDEHKWFQVVKNQPYRDITLVAGRERHTHVPEVLKQMVAAGDMTKRRILITYIILAISNQI